MADVESSNWPWHLAMATACLVIFCFSAWIAWATCNWLWVTRSGALIVAVAIFWESWPVIKTPRVDDMPFYGSQAGHTAIRVAAVIVCIGTVIQGYGDFVSRILPACPTP